jgi:hypothetical protein
MDRVARAGRGQRGGGRLVRRPRREGDRHVASGSARSVSASPTSASTASPRKRATPSASTGWSRRSAKIAKALFGTSAAVSTSTTPGQRRRNAATSPSENAACGCGERITRIASTPAGSPGQASAPKRSSPRTLAGASSRSARLPTDRPASAPARARPRPAAAASTASTILV